MSKNGDRLLRALLAGLLCGCGDAVPPFMPMKLPSGRTIKVQSYLPETLVTGEEALLLKFVPDAPPSDERALDAEVASLWKEVMVDAQKQQGARLVLIRAIFPSHGWTEGRTTQYVCRQLPDGTWSMQKDPDVRVH